MGHQPSLDGLRAISVVAVLLYHAGFGWAHGGFFGVEVFFVVSGFLITSLLLDEREKSGRVDFAQFWLRRAKRLFPALWSVLVTVALWAALFGTDEQISQVRRDAPWALGYLANWGTILGDVPYFAGDPPLLRHLWSLAVEEQWYLIWPLAFVALTSSRLGRANGRGGAVTAKILVGLAALITAGTLWLSFGSARLGGPPGAFLGADRVNFMYLSTLTRSPGLLIGAAAAFVWRPWRFTDAEEAQAGPVLNAFGAASVGMLILCFWHADLTARYIYRGGMILVSVLSLVAVGVGVHPAAKSFRSIIGSAPLVALGRRSYGVYLWSWPISVVVGATHGSFSKFVVAMALTAAISEASYRFVETPIRQGSLEIWWRARPTPPVRPAAMAGVGILALVGFYAGVEPYDRFQGGSDVAGFTTTVPDAPGATNPPAASADLVLVGDSTANSLYLNLPPGLGRVFPDITNGSIEGCGIYDRGSIVTRRDVSNDFSICRGWKSKWKKSAAGSDVALVVIGAWDVFDLKVGSKTYKFDTPAGDEYFKSNLAAGVNALLDAGTNVGLVGVPCMNPIDVASAGVPALPERGDDDRVAHVNEMFREVASAAGSRVRFIEPPSEFCNDAEIATSKEYRWDGVHYYKPGAKLVLETIAPDVLSLAAVAK